MSLVNEMGLVDRVKKARKGIAGIVSGGVRQVAKPVVGTARWLNSSRENIENGFFIGADFHNYIRYWNPVGQIKEIMMGDNDETGEKYDKGLDHYSIGVERALQYNKRHENTDDKDQGPVTLATWCLGLPLGLASYVVAYPLWIRGINRRKTEKLAAEESPKTEEEQNVSEG